MPMSRQIESAILMSNSYFVVIGSASFLVTQLIVQNLGVRGLMRRAGYKLYEHDRTFDMPCTVVTGFVSYKLICLPAL